MPRWTDDPDDPAYDDALPDAAPVPSGGFRDKLRRQPGLGLAWRGLVFVAGLICILGGFALVVLPGPLTIPPIVLGLYIWSTEFAFAHRLFQKAKQQFDEAWEAAKRKPVQAAVVSGGGIVMAGVVLWAVLHFELVDKAKDAVGL